MDLVFQKHINVGAFSTVCFLSSSLLIQAAWKLMTKTELQTTPTVYLNLSEQSGDPANLGGDFFFLFWQRLCAKAAK